MSSKPEPRPCTSCGASIFFGQHALTGSLMPLDAEPAADGKFFLKDGKVHSIPKGMFDPPAEGDRYRSHYATCTEPAKFRKRKGGGRA